MIKKDDLVKQFELLTKQEIKNYKDDLSRVYSKLDFILSGLETEKKTALLNHLKNDSEIHKLRTQIENISLELKGISNIASSFKNNSNSQVEALSVDIKKMQTEIMGNRKAQGTLSLKLFETYKQIAVIGENFSKYLGGLNQIIESLHTKLNKTIDKKVDDLRNEPRESDKQIKEILQKLEVDRVDFDGVMREMRVLKRDNEIKEKHIERLYIEIKRLEEKIK